MKIGVNISVNGRSDNLETVQYNQTENGKWVLPPKTTIADVVSAFSLSKVFTGFFLINGMYATAEHQLKDGDELKIFPPISGG